LELAFIVDDLRLNGLMQLSVDKKIIFVSGAPILIGNDLFIGAFILKPDASISIYTKQFLHAGEEVFFKSTCDYNPKIMLNDAQISISICADIDNPLHAEHANKHGASIYIASLFFTPNGIPNAYKTLSDYAKRYRMNILMSNFCGQSWELDSGGQSGFWDNNGKLIANLNDKDPGLLIVENDDNSWIAKRKIYI
jgi:predicted amidohydrolase